jgi:hypothetical protein
MRPALKQAQLDQREQDCDAGQAQHSSSRAVLDDVLFLRRFGTGVAVVDASVSSFLDSLED